MSGNGADKKNGETAPITARRNRLWLDEFTIHNVRCFAEEQRVPIRPITLLVGENSTGKSSFLGCFRVLHNMVHAHPRDIREAWSSIFDSEPYRMGAFRDIVRRWGQSEKDPQFRLGVRLMTPALNGGNMSGFRVVYSFHEEGTEPGISKMFFIFPNGEEVEILSDRKMPGRVEIIGPNSEFRTKLRLPVQTAGLSGILWAITRWLRTPQWRGEDLPKELQKMRMFFKRHHIDPSLMMRSVWHPASRGEFSIAPIRTRPERTYNPASQTYNPEGDHIPMMMAQLHRTAKKEWEQLHKPLVEFGRDAELFSEFKVKGHDKHVSDPFQLRVKARGPVSNIVDVGYGVSQAFPMMVQVINASQSRKRTTFLIQQPEVHLHPKAQAALGTYFVNSAKDNGHAFLVETHSDFIVDRVRICVAKGLIDPEDVALLYFEPQKSGGKVKIHRIEMNNNGEPARTPPKGYREFFLHETERVLGLRKD